MHPKHYREWEIFSKLLEAGHLNGRALMIVLRI
jgi:hypothetical protein